MIETKKILPVKNSFGILVKFQIIINKDNKSFFSNYVLRL